jgi:phenylacetate-coenzyme A ligase PaaK-like adenylate-forming protein
MGILAETWMVGRFARDLPAYLRQRLTIEEARAIVRRRVAERDTNFLTLMERSVYGWPRSPWLVLLRRARCELGDLRAMVRDRGLEPTLHALRDAGVTVSFEQFKGMEPVVRDDLVLHLSPEDFANPYSPAHYRAQSSGTTSRPVRLPTSFDHLLAMAPMRMAALDAHGVLGAPVGLWRGPLPDGVGLSNLLQGPLVGNVPRRWFSPVTNVDLRPAWKYRVTNALVIALLRRHGIPAPSPERVPLEQAAVVARWASETAREHGRCLMRCTVSLALRIAVDAREHDIDLTGVVFMGCSEPPTAAKVRGIERSGARHITTYTFSEGGSIGVGCAHPHDTNDLHFHRDNLALIQHDRRIPGTEETVSAFHFTTLLPQARRVLINVQSDDYGVVERRSCGCPLEELGYDEHIRHVRSYRKLTGEGVTLVGSEMERILDEVLPARFGGSALDYQLMEEEDAEGFTRLGLLVSPRVKSLDEQAVVQTVLEELSRGSASADLARAFWTQARTLRVRREEPVWTSRGKLIPLRPAANS